MEVQEPVCPESTMESANQRNFPPKKVVPSASISSDKSTIKGESELVCESTIDSANRRGFLKKTALIGVAAAVGSTLLGSKIIPESSASSCTKGSSVHPDSHVVYCCPTGIAIEGKTCSGQGVFGCAATSGIGVYGESYSYYGVLGYSPKGVGVFGWSCSNPGVQGYSPKNIGVYGYSPKNVGVYGTSCCSIAVEGVAGSPSAIPLVARGSKCQSSHLQEWQNCYGTPMSVVDKEGNFGIGTSAPGAKLEAITSVICGSAIVACSVNGVGLAAYSEGSHAIYADSTYSEGVFGTGVKGGVVGVSAGGNGVFGCSTACGYSGLYGVGVTQGVRGTGGKIGVQGCSGVACGIGVFAASDAASVIPLVTKGSSSQIAPLQEWQNGSGTPLSVVNKCGWLGLGTCSPTTTLQVKGSIGAKVVTPSCSTYCVADNCFAVLVNATAAAKTVNLPKAIQGMILYIKNTGTDFAVTIVPKSGDTIEGATSKLLKKKFGVQLIAGGNSPATWYIISYIS